MAGVELDEIPASPPEIEQELLAGFVDAFQRYDVDALVDLLHEDVLIAMPPFELWLRGVADARTFLASMDDGGHDRVLPIAANGQPAVAVWRPNPSTGALDAYALMVLKVAGDKIISIHAFLDPAIFAAFGLSTTVE
jgi:RNA polymerase sigma-70 factor (ECF subfamily)